ncbi:MAG TPA: lipoyl(octanoyl) transferase LipB [Anaerolineae bacterium]|nr:lipoyl(octanoyl) transferase LipB [Anaerolineae bacterium]
MWLLNLGLEPYDRALELQHRLVAARKEGRGEDVLILLEHPPVITLGRRADESHITASPELLARLGIRVYRVERGGDVTYHGPGQIVGYPILDLRGHRQDVGWYVHSLEEVIIRALADFGVVAQRVEGAVGVWVGDGKIAAIGARIESWVTYHGFALNVDPDLRHFDLIVPCGIRDKGITSMRRVLGKPVDLEVVRRRLAQRFGEVFGVTLEEIALPDLESALQRQS